MAKKQIYLAGTFHSEKNHIDLWSDVVQRELKDEYEFYVPQYLYAKSKTEKNTQPKLVELMMSHISKSDIFILNFVPHKESIIPCMELLYASELGLWTCCLDESKSVYHFPWIEYHSMEIFDSLESMIQHFKIGDFFNDD